MACYNLGDYICESRKQLGITQEELAFGICSTGTLSKIENGFVVPKRKNYEAIMQRLGKTMSICNYSCNGGRNGIICLYATAGACSSK